MSNEPEKSKLQKYFEESGKLDGRDEKLYGNKNEIGEKLWN